MSASHVQGIVQDVLGEMKCHGYSPGTIRIYNYVYRRLMKYLLRSEPVELNEKTCLEFLRIKTGRSYAGFYGAGDRKVNRFMKPLQVLLHYRQTGKMRFKKRPNIGEFVCPVQFTEEYQSFQDEYEERQYSEATITCINLNLRKFLVFLADEGVESSQEISAAHLSKFILNYQGYKPRYISTITVVIRNYLSFLYTKNFLLNDISYCLPHVRVMRNAFIPYSWKSEDVRRLLEVIDRTDQMGKRDYAMLLLVVRLGLRVSDIRGMKLSSLNWERKMISLVMQKTKQPLELPILEDVGWAIIDYLKNGRPETTCDRVFVRHRAPYDSFGENEAFQHSLRRYMLKAGLQVPLDVHCGLHSLRSTLARNMLESQTPLPVISGVLGHRSINTTSIYLKIDLEGLRKCTIDPEEVFQS